MGPDSGKKSGRWSIVLTQDRFTLTGQAGQSSYSPRTA
ncbi:hypothetical protein FAES_2799 [Fibrella aestuarina BUZ 2]|uniref:Uncharacterized protein n=1 Tax=Fibrella aestuarina BUZ 2 TaxID=1166018 RepID=I0K9K5_9BACT|nr:hypothetical protein FAES_2799 [Fibrella aestuarina BUZ 2]